MVIWRILCGNEENWDVAIKNKVWGIKPNAIKSWHELLKGDIVFFYITKTIKRIVGVGRIEEKLDPRTYPPKPLWPDEIREGKVVYPYRFSLEPIYICEKRSSGINIDGLRINRMRGMSRITDRDVVNELHKRAKLSWGVDLSLLEGNILLGPSEKEEDIVPPPGGEDKPPEAARLDDYVRRATEQINRRPPMNEPTTIRILIEPLLEVLGWDVLEDEVQRQYPILGGKGTEHVDIALIADNKPKVFVEAKRVGDQLEDYMAKQLINYAVMGNVGWCVLMNGYEVRVYNAYWKVEGVEQRLFFRLIINEYVEKRDKLWLLSKNNIIGGKLDEEGEREYARRKVSDWFRQNEDTIIKDIMKLDPALKEERVKVVINELLSIIQGVRTTR